jgi:2'-5' RNA ligase
LQESIRSFVAIELPDRVRSRLTEIQEKLKEAAGDVRWARPEGIHLTLKFLGNIQEDDIPKISEALAPVASQASPFQCTVGSLGAFPNLKNPRVIWAGVDDPSGQLESLQRAVEARLEGLGFRSEKKVFKPHLTLGRVKSARGKKDLTARVEACRNETMGPIEVNEIILFRSDLKPTGAVYSNLKSFKLRS